MKIYLVRLKNTNVRWFDNDSDLTNFFINAPERLDSYQVTILNAEVDTKITGDKLFDAIQYVDKVEKLIQLYEQFCKRTPWDKTKMTTNAQKVYEKLTTTTPEEKQFYKLMSSSCQRYLLYSVSDSVEWYEAMLDVYPKIKGLAETCEIEYVDPVTRGTSWRGGRTPVKMVKNFEKAKKIK
jgi:hypothetical protein